MPELFDHSLFKILSHPERYAILRRLMASQATLSQLGEVFGKSPANIRHHLKTLEDHGLVAFVEARPVQGGPEKYYRATQRALFIHQAVLPETPQGKQGLIIGSMDSGIRRLADFFADRDLPFSLIQVPLSSLDGLIALRQGLCQMSTCHLIDGQSGDYNRSFVRHLFPSQPMGLVSIYRREEGLIVKPGNPLSIHTLADLARPGIRFVNREPGSGVRQWLDMHLPNLGIDMDRILGYTTIVHSHHSVARSVFQDTADAGVGVPATARALGLDFVPLFEEPYQIAVSPELIENPDYELFFDYLNSGDFRTVMRKIDGYVVPQDFGGVDFVR